MSSWIPKLAGGIFFVGYVECSACIHLDVKTAGAHISGLCHVAASGTRQRRSSLLQLRHWSCVGYASIRCALAKNTSWPEINLFIRYVLLEFQFNVSFEKISMIHLPYKL